MNYNQKVGKFGEEIAIRYLQNKGYKILATNLKISYKEVDIIAKKNKNIIFIEVKTRTSKKFGQADEAFNVQKMANLHWAIEEYIKKNKIPEEFIDINLIAIDIDQDKKIAKIKHFKDIF